MEIQLVSSKLQMLSTQEHPKGGLIQMLRLSFSPNPWSLSIFAGDTKGDSGMARIVSKGQPVESGPQPKSTDLYQYVCVCVCVCVFVEYLCVFC
jgi:hypothetical protein